jgi:hypothetical protein
MANDTDNATSSVEGDNKALYGASTAAAYVINIASPCVLVLGTVGNLLSVIVLLRWKTKRTMPTTIYLVALAIADLCALYAGLLPYWLESAFQFNIKMVSDAGCRLRAWMNWASLLTSAWILVALTLTRTVAAWRPFAARRMCSSKVAAIVVAIVTVSMLGLHLHSVILRGDVTVTKNNVTSVKRCQKLTQEYKDFLTYDWPWLKLCAYSVVPFAIIFVGSICIILKSLQAKGHPTRRWFQLLWRALKTRNRPEHHQ